MTNSRATGGKIAAPISNYSFLKLSLRSRVWEMKAAGERLQLLAQIPVLSLNEAALKLARALVAQGPLAGKAAVDALHIPLATVHGMDYLLTWNCKH